VKVRRTVAGLVIVESVVDLFLSQRFSQLYRIPGDAERAWIADSLDDELPRGLAAVWTRKDGCAH
jgi:hypothetical protein